MNRDRFALEERLHRVSRLRFVEGLTETEIQDRLAQDGQDVSRSTISRDISRAKARFKDLIVKFDAQVVIGQACAQFDSIISDCMGSAASASNSGKAALYRVATGAIAEKLRVLTEAGLLTRTALVVNVRADEPIPNGIVLGDIMRAVQVSDSEVISEAERATRYGERPPQG